MTDLARHSDVSTSHEAGRRARAFLADHHALILGVLWRGMTIHEIGKLTGLDSVAVARRMNELLADRKVRRNEIGQDETGPVYETKPSPSGRSCCVWYQTTLAEREPPKEQMGLFA